LNIKSCLWNLKTAYLHADKLSQLGNRSNQGQAFLDITYVHGFPKIQL